MGMGDIVNAFGQIPTLGLLFGLTIIILSITGDVVSTVQATQTANSVAYNISGNGLTGMLNLSSQFSTIGTIVGLVLIVISLVAGFGSMLRSR